MRIAIAKTMKTLSALRQYRKDGIGGSKRQSDSGYHNRQLLLSSTI